MVDRRLRALRQVVDAVRESGSATGVASVVTEAGLSLFDADGCTLALDALADPATAWRDAGGDGPVPEHGDTAADEAALAERVSEVAFESVLAVPVGDRGVLRVGSWRSDAFDTADRERATVLCSQVDAFLSERAVAEAGFEGAGSVHQYRTLVDQFPNGIVTLFDEDHRYRVVGGHLLDSLPLDASAFHGQRLADVFPPENVAVLEPLYDRALAGEESVTEVQLNGRVFRVRVVPVRDDDGVVVAGMTMSQDVTDRRTREQELAAARERYRTLLQSAPDPIFVADAETGELVEANDAAVALRGEPREDVVGRHQSELHPSADAERYRRLFETNTADGDHITRFPDGSSVYVVDAEGERTPVEISVGRVSLPERTVVYGIFHDVSEQRAYELALSDLHGAARDLFGAESRAAVDRAVVAAAVDVLGVANAARYEFDESADALVPAASECEDDASTGVSPSMLAIGDTAAWRAFVAGEQCERGDGDASAFPGSSVERELYVPLGEYGILALGAADSDAFEGRATDLAAVLGSTAEVAFERAERTTERRDRERELERRTERLERLEAVNDRVRGIEREVWSAETPAAVERAVCEGLVASDAFSFAWVAGYDAVEQSLEPRTWAGDERGYLDDAPFEAGATMPVARAARDRAPVAVSNTASGVHQAAWRSEAVARGFRSVVAVPLVYRGALRGVLGVYADESGAFDDQIRQVLTDLGDLVVNAVASVERKQALLADRVTELEFEVAALSCFLLRFSRQHDCTLAVEHVIPRADGSTAVTLRVQGASTDRIVEGATEAAAVADVDEAGDGDRVEFQFTRPFIGSVLAAHGMQIRNVTADGAACRVTVAVPPSRPVHEAVAAVEAEYPDADLVAKRDGAGPLSAADDANEGFLGSLSDRQREVVELAFRRGYFDSPKRATGADLASALNLSTSAVHQHLRAAERRLLASVFGEDSTADDPSKRGE